MAGMFPLEAEGNLQPIIPPVDADRSQLGRESEDSTENSSKSNEDKDKQKTENPHQILNWRSKTLSKICPRRWTPLKKSAKHWRKNGEQNLHQNVEIPATDQKLSTQCTEFITECEKKLKAMRELFLPSKSDASGSASATPAQKPTMEANSSPIDAYDEQIRTQCRCPITSSIIELSSISHVWMWGSGQQTTSKSCSNIFVDCQLWIRRLCPANVRRRQAKWNDFWRRNSVLRIFAINISSTVFKIFCLKKPIEERALRKYYKFPSRESPVFIVTPTEVSHMATHLLGLCPSNQAWDHHIFPPQSSPRTNRWWTWSISDEVCRSRLHMPHPHGVRR